MSHKVVDNKKLEDYLRRLRENGFTGKVTLNFFKGSVANMNIGQEPSAIWVEESVRLK